MATQTHSGQIVDPTAARVYPGRITVEDGRITAVQEDPAAASSPGFLLPGFVDAHVHVESSMLTPPEFARIAVTHGTVATVSDPHEIANVLGLEGVRYMQDLAARTPLKIFFGIPSCVPATSFETAGACLDAAAVEELCRDPRLLYLSEVMNFPGVVHRDPEVMAKIAAARRYGKHIDGHAPGLRGPDLQKYVAAGIETDHECFRLEEAREKLALGQKILIREGSAAKNFEELWPLLGERPESCMLCSDDKHPDDLLVGHIDRLVARAVAKGVPVFAVLRAACLNPVDHYGLPVGRLRPGDPADFIRVADLTDFRVLETVIDGQVVAREGRSLLPRSTSPRINHFVASPKAPGDFRVPATGRTLRVIEAIDGQIITGAGTAPARIEEGLALADPASDVVKIAVVNRYRDAAPAVAFVRGTGLRTGGLASSVAHDCHNIVAVGCSDEDLARVVNLLVASEGGICAAGAGREEVVPLPVAGIMSDGYAEDVAGAYGRASGLARELGCTLGAPFMTLSFLALLVIPALKLSDLGLFDGAAFRFVPAFADAPEEAARDV